MGVDLTRWLGGGKRADRDENSGDSGQRSAPRASGETQVTQGTTREDLALAEQELRAAEASLRKARATAATLENKERRTRQRLGELKAEYGPIEAAYRALTQWLGRRSGSYAWRLMDALQEERRAAEADEQALLANINADLRVKTGALVRLRLSFHRKVAVIAIAWLIFLFVGIAPRYRWPEVLEVTTWWNVMAWPIWQVVVVGTAFALVLYFLALVAYHRRWSGLWRVLRHEQERNDSFRSSLHAMREEQQRLELLHAQVPTYLGMMSEVVHRPWSDEPAEPELDSGEDENEPQEPAGIVRPAPAARRAPDSAAFPQFLRIADTPREGGGPAVTELVRLSIGRTLRRNWRIGAFERLMRKAEKSYGLPTGTFTPEVIERDPRSRDAFLDALQAGDAQQEAREDAVRDVFHVIRAEFMDRAQPRVRRIDPDPLEGIDLSVDSMARDDESLMDWNEFLGEVIGEPSPWTPFLLKDLQNTDVARIEMRSLAWGPSRLRDEADPATVQYEAVESSGSTSLELVVRVDVLRERIEPQALRAVEIDVEAPSPKTNTTHQAGVQY
jgi:hypothetical protein